MKILHLNENDEEKNHFEKFIDKYDESEIFNKKFA